MSIPTVIRLRSADVQTGGQRFDYRGMHRYLITLPVSKGAAVFTGQDAIVPVLDILRESGWKSAFDIYAYCFLPARLVLIVRGKNDRSDMKRFLASFRESSNAFGLEKLGHTLWARKYLERVLRRSEENRDVARMIFDLPWREGVIAKGEEYPFQGSFVIAQKSSEPRPERRRPPGRPMSRRGEFPTRQIRSRKPPR
jgi:hypothetical protein